MLGPDGQEGVKEILGCFLKIIKLLSYIELIELMIEHFSTLQPPLSPMARGLSINFLCVLGSLARILAFLKFRGEANSQYCMEH